MSIRSDHKALMFVGGIAVLGAGVRVARATGASDDRQAQPALEHQMQAADSAKRAGGKRRPKSSIKAGSVAAVAGIGVPRPKLDVDVATAAQLDSLPGMTPTVAKRIVADRMAHGPFTNLGRLSRVKGVTTKLLQHIDTLVVFSGTIAPIHPDDTVIPRTKRGGAK
jgi:competence protein ComEA